MKLICILCIFLIDAILSNDKKIHLFPSPIMLNSNEVEHIVTESIPINSYELHLTIQSSNPLITGKKREGLWVYVIEDDGKNEKKEEKMKENYFISQYSGIAIKVTDKSIIGINNKIPLSESDFDIEKKTNMTRYEYPIKDMYQKGFEIKITKNKKMISVEVSSNGKEFYLCFFEELSKGEHSHIEMVSNLKGEKAKIEISDVYYKAYSFTSPNSENNDIVDNEKINELYDKFSKVSQVLSSFTKYDKLLKTFESHPFDTIIQEHNNKLEKIKYINAVIEKSLKDSNSLKQKSNNITELMKIIRDVTFEKDSVALMNDKLNEELISSINQLEKNQREMNETIYGLYDIVAKSMKELNEKTSSLEQYSFFKKIILLLLIVCFILLYSIYKSLNEVQSYSKVSTQKEKIEIPA